MKVTDPDPSPQGICQCRWRGVVRAGTKTDGQEGGGRVKCTYCSIVLILKQYLKSIDRVCNGNYEAEDKST
ncbi:MAG: hypothetical protein ACYCSZ_07065 [Burkholderiales bacterium]